MNLKRSDVVLHPDASRVFFRSFEPGGDHRMHHVCGRVMMLPERVVEKKIAEIFREFEDRHHHLRRFLLRQAKLAKEFLISDHPPSEFRQLLLGACLAQEYSLEAAALFNPSIIPHPNQEGIEQGSLRFVLSLRATGEGHISSIVFRTGLIDKEARIRLDKPSPFETAPDIHPNPNYEKHLFRKKLNELGMSGVFADDVLEDLDDTFTLKELSERLQWRERHTRRSTPANREVANGILALASSNYEVSFDPALPISERVLFPVTQAEMKGIEDARFVKFRNDDGETTYYATYTAYDGQMTLPQILETADFSTFKISTLNGPEVQGKGMALFPRKVDGHFMMLSRQDGESLFLMTSDMVHFWYSKRLLIRPTFPWECVQIGNCGSPIETEAGWLVLTHGVGPMRKYSIGALLLDLDDPLRVIGRLSEPLLSPNENEREGYVPNVVYTCGAIIHADQLVLPYAMSDRSSTFATVALGDLLEKLLQNGPNPR